jgi:death-on-curing protein
VPLYLTAEEIQQIHRELMDDAGAQSILLRPDAFESAVQRPMTAGYYGGADIYGQAASLVAGIALAHAFFDGNKRLAYASCGSFLLVNGIRVAADPEDAARQVLALVVSTEPLDAHIE